MGELHQRTTETMPVVSAVGVFFFPLDIYTAMDLHCNSVKRIRAKLKGGEQRGKSTDTCVPS